jgi:hypothetical protein
MHSKGMYLGTLCRVPDIFAIYIRSNIHNYTTNTSNAMSLYTKKNVMS